MSDKPAKKKSSFMPLDDEEAIMSSADTYVSPKPRPVSPHAALFEKKFLPKYKGKMNEYPKMHSVLNPSSTLPADFKWSLPLKKSAAALLPASSSAAGQQPKSAYFRSFK